MTYDWKNISPNDSFQINGGQSLSQEDQRTMHLLYLPIIGREAYSLYMHFNLIRDRSDGQNHYLKDVFSILDLGIQDFFKARIHLEGIALMDTFKENDHYLFEIKRPLGSQAFLEDDILSHMLLQKLGQSSFHYIVDQLSEESVDRSSYEKISRRFIDVYPYSINRMSLDEGAPEVNLQQHLQAKPPHISQEESSFEWDVFLESIRPSFLKLEQVENQKFKSYILFLHECYGINELEMGQLLMRVSDLNTGEIHLDKLKSFVRENYQVQASNDFDQFIDPPVGKTTPSLDEPSASDQALIQASQDNSPVEFLTSMKEQLGGYVSSNERWVVEQLVDQSQLPPAVINILLHYIIVVKKNTYLHSNFANQIANDWAMKKIDSPQAALQAARSFAKKREETSPSYRRPSSKKPAKHRALPDWSREENYQDHPVSDDNSQSLKERIQALREKVNKEGE